MIYGPAISGCDSGDIDKPDSAARMIGAPDRGDRLLEILLLTSKLQYSTESIFLQNVNFLQL